MGPKQGCYEGQGPKALASPFPPLLLTPLTSSLSFDFQTCC